MIIITCVLISTFLICFGYNLCLRNIPCKRVRRSRRRRTGLNVMATTGSDDEDINNNFDLSLPPSSSHQRDVVSEDSVVLFEMATAPTLRQRQSRTPSPHYS